MRITLATVHAVFAEYVETARALGFDMTGAYMQEGDAGNGQMWRLFVDSGVTAPGAGDRGYIGATKREACETMWTILRAWHAVSSLGK
ncbi:hypothetical protein PP459_gp018 [Streptomyces phage Wakanda]|uniref:Uncharacterized protein n=1 Tax=Streptomyces phage Wakanda TaxID=2713267 RepID=A0A6G8R1X8_9CAUD|nr:hypothetical protein PP459_gp018 [Streptomyces phage Wakanda]QIN94215.1 hypothetical protein SEA_WAKANDA_255 [Streptomyces phage Wakanda]